MQRSASLRECYNCKEQFPESDELQDPRGDPMLMDPDHEGLEHWKVCAAKHTPDEIKKSIFFWKKKKEKEAKTHTVIPYTGQKENMVDNPIAQVKFDPSAYVLPEQYGEVKKEVSTIGRQLSKEAEDYILTKFDETCNSLIQNQAVFAKSIADQLQIIYNQLATLASNQRSIMRKVGIPDT